MNSGRNGRVIALGAVCAALVLGAGLAHADGYGDIAAVNVGQNQIFWQASVSNNGGVLTVNGPDGYHFRQEFKAGQQASFDAQSMADGEYNYELLLYPALDEQAARSLAAARESGTEAHVSEALRIKGQLPSEPQLMSGTFRIQQGTLVFTQLGDTQKPDAPVVDSDDGVAKDNVIADDLIVQMSACIGTDCNNGENFGFDTLRLKENNLRIKFDDTSNSGSFPNFDWQLTANDSSNGGANYFAIEDITSSKVPFTIEGASANHSLYVDSNGSVGFGTNTPVVELHVKDGDSPTLRLEQDGSSGFTPQIWDVAGNETNFFVRDVTNGSQLPFKIKPGADHNALFIDADNSIGLGTASPTAKLDIVEPSNANVSLFLRNNTVSTYFNATDSEANFGTSTNYPLRLAVNGQWKMRLNSDNSVNMQNGASLTAAGVWTDASSRELKDNIRDLSLSDALAALTELNPVRYNYKVDSSDEYVGFIAEDVPDLVASKTRKGMSPMDVVAVLTKVVQQQQERIDQLEQLVVHDAE